MPQPLSGKQRRKLPRQVSVEKKSSVYMKVQVHRVSAFMTKTEKA